jgi:hypothetical protein
LHDLGIAAALHNLVAAVPADIDKTGKVRLVANDDHRDAAGIAGDVVAEVLQLAERTDVVPGLAKDMGDLQLGDRGIGIPVGGKRLATIERGEQPGGVIGYLAHAASFLLPPLLEVGRPSQRSALNSPAGPLPMTFCGPEIRLLADLPNCIQTTDKTVF